MTDQMFIFLCRDVRKYAYEYRRGELEDVERRKFDEHVATCEQCQDYVNRLEGMLDSAAVHEYGAGLDREEMFESIVDEVRRRDGGSAWARADSEADADDDEQPLDRDRLFSRITEELAVVDGESPSTSRDNVVPLAERIEQAADAPQAESSDSRPVSVYVIAALAAGLLIGIALPYLLDSPSPAPEDRGVAKQEQPDEAEPVDEPKRVEARLADLTLQPTPASVDDVRVFGEPMANWSIASQGKRRTMKLDRGTVLVEFVGRDDAELSFEADRFTVHVTGTIFYASAEDGLVGVVTGSVEVETRDGDTVRLVDGQEWVDGEGLRAAPKSTRRDATLHVDPDEHRRALKRAARDEGPPAPEKLTAPRPPMSKEVAKTPRERLRNSADQALRDGRYAVAAQYYERMVAEFSAADPANASLRLDLARIYIRHLHQPARAAVHLRRFVEDRPGDPARASAKSELCRIVSETGQIEPICDF